jgi:hypothetical protein
MLALLKEIFIVPRLILPYYYQTPLFLLPHRQWCMKIGEHAYCTSIVLLFINEVCRGEPQLNVDCYKNSSVVGYGFCYGPVGDLCSSRACELRTPKEPCCQCYREDKQPLHVKGSWRLHWRSPPGQVTQALCAHSRHEVYKKTTSPHA